MRRREFITFAGSVVVWPLTAHAQQTALPVIGFVNSASRQAYAPQLAAFLKGLSEVGYIVGSNVAIEYRWTDGQYDRLLSLAADLVKLQVGSQPRVRRGHSRQKRQFMGRVVIHAGLASGGSETHD
jgi:putative ABC transport system substrate-binding protein